MPTGKTIYRKDYQPYPFLLEKVDLQFDLFEEETLVEGTMVFQRQAEGPLYLYGDELELVSIAIDGVALHDNAYQKDGDNLILATVPDHFLLTIKTRIFPSKNTHLSGLYRSRDLFCTQCEAEGFRRVVYFPDRPDVMTKYTTRITAEAKRYPVLLSNGNLKGSGQLPEGRHWVEWEDPFKKPSYLFALVAGDLACVKDTFKTCSGKEIDLRLYVEHGQESKCAHAMTSLKHAMKWDEEHYGREYDLALYMIVAVSDFNMGAMENKGLNLFNAKYILASPETATDGDYAAIEGVVGHEYFHNWSGNRVTCRDWFQLSLKEGLTVFRDQEFSRDQYFRAVKRIDDVQVLRAHQFPEDGGGMAHPVRPDSYEEINNFYTATIYNKGAEVIRMQHTLLGAAGFRKGMDLYFKKHDGQAVTIDDFVAAMEEANQVDLTQFKRWYSQAGTPQVQVSLTYQNHALQIHMQQTCAPTPECKTKAPFHIPIRIAIFSQAGEPIALPTDVLELREATQSFTIPHVPEGSIVSLLRDFSAPIQLRREMSDEDQLALLRVETDGFAKWEAAQQLALSHINRWVEARSVGQLPISVKDVYVHVLQDEQLDKALRAELVLPPGFEEVCGTLTSIDVNAIEDAREGYRLQIASHMQQEALTLIDRLWQAETHQMNPTAFEQRKLRHACLSLLCRADLQDVWPLCEQQFKQAKTMSDEMAAFTLLCGSKELSRRQGAITQFYEKWSHEALVMDKWFSAQVLADLPDILTHVRSLLAHPAFSFENPNKVRAVIGAFTHYNHKHFHAIDGQGYAFLTEILIKLDAINPQVAARLATPFTRFKRFEPIRQALMQAQLEQLLKRQLSKDLDEVVRKSLAPVEH